MDNSPAGQPDREKIALSLIIKYIADKSDPTNFGLQADLIKGYLNWKQVFLDYNDYLLMNRQLANPGGFNHPSLWPAR